MNASEYQNAVRAAGMAARMLLPHDIPKMLAAIERADAMGPFLDPTVWRDKRDAMLEDREMLRAALPLYELAQKLAAMGIGE